MRQTILALEPDWTPRLDQFVVGPNRELVDRLRHWHEAPPEERMIYLWGPRSCGKTHLLRALVPASRHIACETTTRIAADRETLLAIDDVHRLGAEGAIDLFHRYNERREGGMHLLVSGLCPPGELALLPDLRSRLAWGLVLRIQPLGDEDKFSALQRHAANLGLDFPDHALNYLLSHCPRDNNYLFGLMKTLQNWTISTHRNSITLPMIRTILDQQPGTPPCG